MPVLRIIYKKTGISRFISANYIGKIFERCLRRIPLSLEFSQGFNRRVRLTLGPPLAVGITGNNEVIDVRVKDEDISVELIKGFLNSLLPEGLSVIHCRYLEKTEKSPPDIKAAHYIIRVNNIGAFPALPEGWNIVGLESDYLKIEVKLEKFNHRQLFNLFGSNSVLERFLIF